MEFGFKKKVVSQVAKPALKTFRVEEDADEEPVIRKQVKTNEKLMINVNIKELKFCKHCKTGFSSNEHLARHNQEFH
ncbi:unnamed protein product [Blepharisma stoltei]|uniref:C2H2-type domain-containing protein n=1 Tax=Blepharisma stoltei TaxID=1481888 RepID=A0AAU9IGA5_9CILI|nr:unnamed protein product [Blepharisma stoltei]